MITHDQISIYLRDFFGHQAKLRNTFRIDFSLVTKRDRLQCENCFTRFIHRLDFILEAGRGSCNAKLTVRGYHNRGAADPCLTDSSDERTCLRSLRADADCICVVNNARVADINIIIARTEVEPSGCAQGNVVVARCIVEERACPDAGVVIPRGVIKKGVGSVSRIVLADSVVKKTFKTRSGVASAVVLW